MTKLNGTLLVSFHVSASSCEIQRLLTALVARLAIKRAVDSAPDDSNSGVAVALGNARPVAAAAVALLPLALALALALLLPRTGRDLALATLARARRDGHAGRRCVFRSDAERERKTEKRERDRKSQRWDGISALRGLERLLAEKSRIEARVFALNNTNSGFGRDLKFGVPPRSLFARWRQLYFSLSLSLEMFAFQGREKSRKRKARFAVFPRSDSAVAGGFCRIGGGCARKEKEGKCPRIYDSLVRPKMKMFRRLLMPQIRSVELSCRCS